MGLKLTGENIATLIMDGSTIILACGLFTQTNIMRRRGRKDDRLFFLMLFFDVIAAVADIVTYIADGKDFWGARYFNLGGTTVFYIALVLLTMIFYQYSLARFKKPGESGHSHKVFFIPGLITEALLLVNLFTGIFYYVDEKNAYHYGRLFIMLFVVMGVYLAVAFVHMARYRHGETGKSLIPVWIYMLPILAGVWVPFVFGGISITSICIAVAIAFTHLGSAAEAVNDNREYGEEL